MSETVSEAPTLGAIKEAFKLNPDAKRAILASLRDPAIRQIYDWFYNGQNGYCTVGVVCEAYRLATGKGRWNWESSYWSIDGKAEHLVERWCFDTQGSDAFFNWIGAVDRRGAISNFKLEYEGKIYGLERLGLKVDFKTLADLIEAQL